MTRGARLGVIVGSILILSTLSATAEAERDGDGIYGRWDRGLTLALGAGPGTTWISSQKAEISVLGEARLLVADVAGLVVSGRWGPEVDQYLFLGVDVRPLFPSLFFLYKQTWNEFADLLLQSFFLELGGAFLLDGNGSAGLGVGFGFAIPVYRPLKALEGLWFRIGTRYINAKPQNRNTESSIDRSEWTLYLTFVVRLGFKANVAGWAPPRYRSR